MIFFIGSNSPAIARLSGKDATSTSYPSWKKLLSCRQSRTIHEIWLESRLIQPGTEDESAEIVCYEHRGANPLVDISFLLGYLWHYAQEFRGGFTGSPVIILHFCEGVGERLIVQNPVNLGSSIYYPDLVLGQSFSEEEWVAEPQTFLNILYNRLTPLLAPHQLLGFSLDPLLERKKLYPLINTLKDYARALDNLHLEERQFAQSAVR